ncbi:MAG: hypothetical protein ACKOYG_05310 [Ilumatobacteraceae bacterium]
MAGRRNSSHGNIRPSRHRRARRHVARACAILAVVTTCLAPHASAARPITSLTWSPTELSFGSLAVGATDQKSILLTNTGTKTIRKPGISVIGVDFFVGAENCSTSVLRSGDSCTVTIVFAPSAGGAAIGAVSTVAAKTTIAASLLGSATTTATATSVTVGRGHACAVTTTGALVCWGDNLYGQLGDNSVDDRRAPVGVSGLATGIAAAAAGEYHTCALTTTGGVKCWGRNNLNQLGNSTGTDSSVPVDVPGLGSGVTALAAGDSHTCAVKADGTITCWGNNSIGQLGNSVIGGTSGPVQVANIAAGATAVAAGRAHTCAIVSSGVKCWGDNFRDQLGLPAAGTYSTEPVDVTGLSSGVTSITAGVFTSCAVLSAAAVCWGYSTLYEMGDGSTDSNTTPGPVTGLSAGVALVFAGDNHGCAVTSAGALSCWGYAGYGQIGNGSVSDQPTPVAVTGLGSGVLSGDAGTFSTCAVLADAVKCWGSNDSGLLGSGTFDPASSTPVDVVGF